MSRTQEPQTRSDDLNTARLREMLGSEFVELCKTGSAEQLRAYPGTRPVTTEEYRELTRGMTVDHDQRQLTDEEYERLYPNG